MNWPNGNRNMYWPLHMEPYSLAMIGEWFFKAPRNPACSSEIEAILQHSPTMQSTQVLTSGSVGLVRARWFRKQMLRQSGSSNPWEIEGFGNLEAPGFFLGKSTGWEAYFASMMFHFWRKKRRIFPAWRIASWPRDGMWTLPFRVTNEWWILMSYPRVFTNTYPLVI